jgi:hypothetical protein
MTNFQRANLSQPKTVASYTPPEVTGAPVGAAPAPGQPGFINTAPPQLAPVTGRVA